VAPEDAVVMDDVAADVAPEAPCEDAGFSDELPVLLPPLCACELFCAPLDVVMTADVAPWLSEDTAVLVPPLALLVAPVEAVLPLLEVSRRSGSPSSPPVVVLPGVPEQADRVIPMAAASSRRFMA